MSMASIETPIPPEQIPAQVDNLISLRLHLWQALTVAIQNAWGISSSAQGEDKRAWLAGALSDMFTQNQLRDVEDLEDVLQQVMFDEFEVVVDDGTLEETAAAIWSGRQRVLKGDGSEVRRLTETWEEKRRSSRKEIVQVEEVEEEGDSEEDGEWTGFDDHRDEMDVDEAPQLVDGSTTRKKPEPEVDEDGFTKVVGKKKR